MSLNRSELLRAYRQLTFRQGLYEHIRTATLSFDLYRLITKYWGAELAKRVLLKPVFFSHLLFYSKLDVTVRKTVSKHELLLYLVPAYFAYLIDECLDNGHTINELEHIKDGDTFIILQKVVDYCIDRENSYPCVEPYNLPLFLWLKEYVTALLNRSVPEAVVRDVIRSLEDVLDGEIAIKSDNVTKILWAPLPGKIAIFDEMNTLHRQQVLSIYNPGVVMVAVQHYVQHVALQGKEITTPSELFNDLTMGQMLRKYAHLCSFLVRLSDDWGDQAEDTANKDPNLFLSKNIETAKKLSEILEVLIPIRDEETERILKEKLEHIQNPTVQAEEVARGLSHMLTKVHEGIVNSIVTKNIEDSVRNSLLRFSQSLFDVSYLAISLGTVVNDQDFDANKA